MRHGQRMINSLHPAEIASLIESLPPAKREIVWEFVDPELEGDVLIELNEEVRAELIGGMDAEELIAATEGMEVDDLADLIGDLPETLNERVLRSMDAQDRERLSAVLGVRRGQRRRPHESRRCDRSPGRHARSGPALPAHARRAARAHGPTVRRQSPRPVSRRPRHHATADRRPREQRSARSWIRRSKASHPIRPRAKSRSCSRIATSCPPPSSASDGKLLGRITIDDVVDVIREEADHSVMSMAGLGDDEDMFAGVITSARRRAIWLGVNLATAFLAANVVGLFEATIEKVVALAVLMPIVASMGGIAGSQTLVLIIRGLALGQIEQANARWLLIREIAVGLLEWRGRSRRSSASRRASGSRTGRSAASSSPR